MKTPKPEGQPKESRHGKHAETTKQTSITMRKEVLERARKAAADENRNFSNWLETFLRKHFEEEDKKRNSG